ncbi:unnamed protein product [Linum tenue]|uniref:Uncharacterized protein n=1 Tax=Linum tenue TaxID=586396 RepID=A0AAV0M1Z9_9ROSI|nr:unnamed protein product [Linum tenue]
MLLQSEEVLPATGFTAGGDHPIQSAVFDETVWGGHFLTDDQWHPVLGPESGEHETLKEEVRMMVTIAVDNTDDDTAVAIKQKLRLINAIQCLGIGYHFEMEIEEALKKVYTLGGESFIESYDDIDLHHVSLWFRLLRQQGFRVSSDVFRKFKDGDKGKFKESLALDGQGLLSLYEAAHVAIHGEEDMLDEALSFTTKNLELVIQDPKTSSSFKKQVEFSLALPIWKCVPRTLARHRIDVYSETEEQEALASPNETVILKLAKLDFNMVQGVHQQELHELTMSHRVGRIILTKCGAVLTLMDDFYDNFGDYEQLEILTGAIQRLDILALEELPEAMMKDAYRVVVVNLFQEMEQAVSETAGPTYGLQVECRRRLPTSRLPAATRPSPSSAARLLPPTVALLSPATRIVDDMETRGLPVASPTRPPLLSPDDPEVRPSLMSSLPPRQPTTQRESSSFRRPEARRRSRALPPDPPSSASAPPISCSSSRLDQLEPVAPVAHFAAPTVPIDDLTASPFKNWCRSLLAEAWWRTEGHVPTLGEYLAHANITSSYFFVCASAYLGIGPELATREAFQWVTDKTNKMVLASASICRVQNDIMSYSFEQERLHVASAVQCYIKEHGVSDEEAILALLGRISDAWKDMTEVMCCQKPITPFPAALLSPVINFARSISVIYLKADAFTYPQLLKERIAALFIDPVPL